MTDALVARLLVALAFYADRDSYRWQPQEGRTARSWEYPVVADGGRRARIALGLEAQS